MWVSESSHFPEESQELLAFYISLLYGDPGMPRTVSYALAKTHGLLTHETAFLDREYEETVKREKEHALRLWSEERREVYLNYVKCIEEENQCVENHVWDELTGEWKPMIRAWSTTELSTWLKLYLPLMLYPDLQVALKPYFTARFAPQWAEILAPINQILVTLLKDLDLYRVRNKKALEKKEKYLQYLRKRDQFWSFFISPEKVNEPSFGPYWKNSVLDSFQRFIEDYGEGALITLILLDRAREPWPRVGDPYFRDGCLMFYAGIYEMMRLPAIVNRQPLEVALFLNGLAKIIANVYIVKDFACGYWTGNADSDPYGRKDRWGRGGILVYYVDPQNIFGTWLLKKHIEGIPPSRIPDMEAFRREWFCMSRRPDIAALTGHDDFVITYLERRAFDLAAYGEKIANLTFPEPVLKGATPREIEVAVIFLRKLARRMLSPGKQGYLDRARRCVERVEESVNEYFSKQVIPLPKSLAPRVLAATERQALLSACRKQLIQAGDNVQNALTVIKEFAKFCSLLSKPENHIKAPSGQYIEREYNSRQYVDMENEMAWQLTNLAKQTAYVKLTQKEAGRQLVLKRNMQTYPLPPRPAGRDPIALERFIVERSFSLYYQKREQIEQEIWQRQKKWLAGILETPLPTDTGSKNKQVKPSRGGTLSESLEPPDTSFSV